MCCYLHICVDTVCKFDSAVITLTVDVISARLVLTHSRMATDSHTENKQRDQRYRRNEIWKSNIGRALAVSNCSFFSIKWTKIIVIKYPLLKIWMCVNANLMAIIFDHCHFRDIILKTCKTVASNVNRCNTPTYTCIKTRILYLHKVLFGWNRSERGVSDPVSVTPANCSCIAVSDTVVVEEWIVASAEVLTFVVTE